MIVRSINETFTPEELARETSRVNNGVTITLYEGDEPVVEEVPAVEPPNWLGLEQGLFYSGLRAKAKSDPNLDHFEYASLIGAFGNGKLGYTSEATLQYLLTAINVAWSESDIVTLNGLLEENNFTIRLT